MTGTDNKAAVLAVALEPLPVSLTDLARGSGFPGSRSQPLDIARWLCQACFGTI